MSATILGGQMPNTGVGSETVGWFRVSGEFDSVEFSVDGGTTWAATASLAGGTLAADVTVPRYIAVQLVPTEAGVHVFQLRTKQATGTPGPAFDAYVRVIAADASGFFRLYDSRLTWYTSARTDTGFAALGNFTDLASGDDIPVDNTSVVFADNANNSTGTVLACWGADGDVVWKVTFYRSSGSTATPSVGSVAYGNGVVYVLTTADSSGASYHRDGLGVQRSFTGQRLLAFDVLTGGYLWTIGLTNFPTGGFSGTFTSVMAYDEYFDGLYLVSESGSTTGSVTVSTSDGQSASKTDSGRYRAIVKVDTGSAATEWVRILANTSTSSAVTVFSAAASATELALGVTHSNSGELRLHTTADEYETYPGRLVGIISIDPDGAKQTYRNFNTATSGDTPSLRTRLFTLRGVIDRYFWVGSYDQAANATFNFGQGNVDVAGDTPTVFAGTFSLGVDETYDPMFTFVPENIYVVGEPTSGVSSFAPSAALDKDGNLLITARFDGTYNVAGTNMVSEGGTDIFLTSINPLTGVPIYRQQFYRQAASLDELLPNTNARAVLSPAPSGGGVGILRVTPDAAVETTLETLLGDGTLAIPAGATLRSVLYTFDRDGLPGNLPPFPLYPPGDGGAAAPPFVQVAWPGTANQDTPVNAIATVSNPELPAAADEPPYPGEIFDYDPTAGSTIPAAPANLTAVAGNTQAFLEWDASSGAVGYRIYRADLIGDLAVGETATTDYLAANLANGTAVTFRVEAINGAGASSRSSVTVTPTSTGPYNDPDVTWTNLRWELWDAEAGEWFTGSREFDSANFGRGTFTLTPHDPAVHTDPEALDYVAPYTAGIAFEPADYWFGTLRSLLRVVATRSDGVVLTSAPTALVTVYADAYDPPTTPEGDMPAILENQVSVGTFTTFDPDSTTLTWQLSPQTGDPYGTTSTTSITVMDDGDPVGTASITGGQGTATAQVSFTPVPNINGLFEFSLRVGDGGDGEGNDGWTSWVYVTVEVGSVITPPSAPTPNTMPTIAEDGGPAERLFTVTDADVDPGGDPPQAYWELAPKPNDNQARDDFITLAAGLVEIIDEDEVDADADLTATVRYTPALNFTGNYSFYLRAYKTVGGERYTGPWTKVTGTVTPVPDRPTPPQPRVMPTVELGDVATGAFTTFDPDGAPWTWQVAATEAGTYGSSVTLSGVGTVAVAGATTTGTVTFVQDPAFTGGRYNFWLRVLDSTSPTPLVSDPVQVRGFVAVAEPTAFLTLLERTETSATLRRLGALPISDLSVTESVTGPGGAEATVDLAGVRRIAGAEAWTVDELLYPGGVELHVAVGGELVFAGPVTSHEVGPDLTTVRISAEGLANYLESRAVEGATAASFTADRADEIMAELLYQTQQLDYGELLITDETDPVGNPFTTSFEPGTELSRAFEELGTRLGGPEWWITPDRELRTAALRGTDKRASILLTDGSAELERETDDADLATVAEVEGDDVLGSATATTELLERFGRRYVRLAAERLDTEEAVDALAAQHVADFGRPVPTRRLTHFAQRGAVVGPFAYGAGDAITVENTGPDGVERVGVRVISRTAKLVGPAAWTVDCDVEVVGSGALRPARSRHLPSLYDQLYDALYG